MSQYGRMMNQIIRILNELRKNRHMTLDELSDLTGIPYGTVKKTLNGQIRSPSFDVVTGIMKTLGYMCDTEAVDYDECRILEIYRTLSKEDKEDVGRYMKEKNSERGDVE